MSIVLLHAAAVCSRLPERPTPATPPRELFRGLVVVARDLRLLDGFRVQRSTGYCRSAQEEQRSSSDRCHNGKPDSEFAFEKVTPPLFPESLETIVPELGSNAGDAALVEEESPIRARPAVRNRLATTGRLPATCRYQR